MTRVRTHHEFVQRPVWHQLGGDAFLLHHAALAFVNAHGTDGFVHRKTAPTLHPGVKAPARRIRDLVDAGIWAEEGDQYRVCDVQDDLRVGGGRGDEQPSAAYVAAEIDRARERKEQWKQRKNGNGNVKRNGVPTGVRNIAQGRTGQDMAVQDSYESSPAPRLTSVVNDEDCEHGVDRRSSCRRCPSLKVANS